MALISVIVPVYKVEKYIHRCIDSILAQTFTDFELILVDDGSPDNCGAICDEYAAKDPRIHVIHQQNGGLSAARNAGIDWAFENSNSEWLIFIDSDDWVEPEMFSLLLSAANSTESEIARCILSECDILSNTAIPDMIVQNPADAYIEKRFTMSACAKLFHKYLFSNIRFPVGRVYEDAFTTYKLFFQTKQIVTVDKLMYHIEQNMDSITRSPWTPKRLDELDAYEVQLDFFASGKYQSVINEVASRYVHIVLQQYNCVKETDLPTCRKRRYQNILSSKMRSILRKYKNNIPYSFGNAKYLYEVAYPISMYVYWFLLAQWNKLIGKRK